MTKQILVFLFFGLFFWFLVRNLQLKAIFIPFRDISETPKSFGLDFSEIYIKTSDGPSINAWYIPAKGAQWTLYFLHGNGGNLSHRAQKIAFLNTLGVNVFIIDYRGYGRSSGEPSEKGLYLDAQAGYDYLIHTLKVSPDSVVLIGESLGAAVAIDLASKNKTAGLIVEGAFTSAKDMARFVMPILPSVLLVARFDSLSKIGKVSVPKLFIHSRNDEIVPYALGRKIFDAAPGPKYFLELRGGHNEVFFLREAEIKEKMAVFFKTLEGGKS